MEKYKDYVARTQQDRIQLDTLYALEKILDLMKAQENFAKKEPKLQETYNDEQIASDEVAKQITDATQKKPRKKNGGDK